MKETTDRFNKDKKTQEEKAANKITELERQSSDMEQRQRKLVSWILNITHLSSILFFKFRKPRKTSYKSKKMISLG